MADFWKIVEVNTGICVPKYLKNILMLNGYDDASSVKSITKADLDSIEEFVKNGIDEYIGDGEAKDFYHIFHSRKDQFIIMKGDRVKLMDVVEFVRNKLASEGGYKLFQQTLEPTSSQSLHSQELPAILFIDNDDNQPIKTESNLNDRQLWVSSTTGAESLPTEQKQITSFSREDSTDDVKDENLLDPLRFRTPSPSPMKVFWGNENVIEDENDTTFLARKVKKELKIVQYATADVDGESDVDVEMLEDENAAINIFHCDICGEIFTSKGMLKQHMKFHKGVKLHICSVCGYAFTLRYDLKRHLRIHSGEKPYACDVCSKKFRRSSDVSVHKRIHTGEKPYVCDVCDKEFTQSAMLSEHKNIHTGEKPFVCAVCPKAFRCHSSLSAHKRIHTGELHVCDVCHKAFTRSATLRYHRKRHFEPKIRMTKNPNDKKYGHRKSGQPKIRATS